MGQFTATGYLGDWIKTPLTTLGLRLQEMECAGAEPELVQGALRDHEALTQRINTLLSILREDEESERKGERPPAILMVDHNPVIMEAYRDYLTEQGLQVDTFDNGARAVEAARIRNYACAVLDVPMPGIRAQSTGMDGRAVCRALRDFTDMPVIFLSCCLYRWQAEVDDLIRENDAYLEKPCEREKLYQQILCCLGQAREPPEVQP